MRKTPSVSGDISRAEEILNNMNIIPIIPIIIADAIRLFNTRLETINVPQFLQNNASIGLLHPQLLHFIIIPFLS